MREVAKLIEAPEFDDTRSLAEQPFLPEGFAQFNHCDTLCVDVPDAGFTISARTSQGKRVTFYFGPYKTGGTPQFVDIQYHDNGTTRNNGSQDIPTFDALMFAGGTGTCDSRKAMKEKPSLICLLMEDPKEPE